MLPEVGEPAGPDVGRGMNIELSDDEIEQFTCGDCWVLAWELHQQGGFPIYVAVRGENVQREWVHAFVKVGDQYLDANGLQSEWDIEFTWSGEVRPVPDHVVKNWDHYSRWMCFPINPNANRYPEQFADPAEVASYMLDCLEDVAA